MLWDNNLVENSFEINVLVNGNRCKQYCKDGKTYIEAKYNSEYELEIKNNTHKRVLSLISVDGLSVLTGNLAGDDDPGYILPSLSPLKIKGFRYSANNVAAFKFTNKENSYAQNTGGSFLSRNCGVIGVRIFSEKIHTPSVTYHISSTTYGVNINDNILWKNMSNHSTGEGFYQTNVVNSALSCNDDSVTTQCYNCSANCSTNNFDMGSTWGRNIESRTVEVEFERGNLIYYNNIYYASRSSLIDMGISLNNSQQIYFPESFPNKFASPPKGWIG